MSEVVWVVMVRARGAQLAGLPKASCTSEAIAEGWRDALAALPETNELHLALERTYVEPVPHGNCIPPALLEMAA